MRKPTPTSLVTGVATTVALLLGSVVLAGPAEARPAAAQRDERSLTSYLAEDGSALDTRWGDYDIAERVLASVLEVDPESELAVLTDGSTRLTVFLPQDRAFRKLVAQATGAKPETEVDTLSAVDLLGTEFLQDVLLCHVVPDRTLSPRKVRRLDGQRLDTLLEGTPLLVQVSDPTVRVKGVNGRAKVVAFGRNKGNLQIAHGIKRVLLPVQL